jgi:hypothetical protein
VRFVPEYDRNGDVKSVNVGAVTANRPTAEKGGPFVHVTFRLPKRLFGPTANVIVELDEDSLDGTPQVLAADLKAMRDAL